MGAGQCAGEPVLTVPAWRRGWRTMAQDLAKSSSRTRRKQRRALRVDRFGSERTQRNEVLSRKTGRQAKFCRTSDQNFLDAPRATKFIVLQGIMQQILAFPPSRLVGADLEAVTAGLHGKSNAMAQRPAPAQSLIEGSRRFDLGTGSSIRFDDLIRNLWTTHVASPLSIVRSIKNGLHKITAARNPAGCGRLPN
jgi:hypothetical protein